ncbi:MAG: hypothetical protein M1815_003583 [Lichina confinis]|nr:MAG: hypothetical protein M1815_003583 [Lichina confinis]
MLHGLMERPRVEENEAETSFVEDTAVKNVASSLKRRRRARKARGEEGLPRAVQEQERKAPRSRSSRLARVRHKMRLSGFVAIPLALFLPLAASQAAQQPPVANANANANAPVAGANANTPAKADAPAVKPPAANNAVADVPAANVPAAKDPVAKDPAPKEPAAKVPAAKDPVVNNAAKEVPPAAPVPAAAPVPPPVPGNIAPGGGGAAGAPPVIPTQVPPVTAINVPTTLPDGRITMMQTVYTQTFASVLDQLPSPTPGKIGLGTLTGSVGAVRTEQAKSDASRSARPAGPAGSRPLPLHRFLLGGISNVPFCGAGTLWALCIGVASVFSFSLGDVGLWT